MSWFVLLCKLKSGLLQILKIAQFLEYTGFVYIYSVYNIIYRPPRLYKNKRPAARAVVISRDTPFTEGVSLKGGRLSPCRKSKTIITHTAVNGPSGFKSKHLNFFCRRCYRVKILILRKCHLGNFPQIHFNPIKAGGI